MLWNYRILNTYIELHCLCEFIAPIAANTLTISYVIIFGFPNIFKVILVTLGIASYSFVITNRFKLYVLLSIRKIRKFENVANIFKFYFIFLSFVFLGPYPRHMEVPRLGVQLKLQLLAYTTATAMPDPSHI